jgi:N-acetylmuramoyl-L-alanine amidase
MAVKDKYSIERKYVTNSKARSRAKLNGGKPKYFVAHETANNTADADNHYRYFQGITISASAHTFIDDGKILEIIPLDEKAWHVQYQQDRKTLGLGAANDNAVGTELCRTGSFSKAYDRFVWYHAYLCKKYGKQPKRHITAHKFEDPARRSDPHSWLEPNGVSWSKFLNDVQRYYDNWGGNASVKVEQKATPKKTATTSTSASKAGYTNGKAGQRVESIYGGSEGLNYYSKPSFDAKPAGTFKKGAGWTIRKRIKVGNAYMYEVENSKGAVYYVTASAAYVKVEGSATKAKAAPKKATAKPKASGSAIVPYPGKLIRKGSRGKDVQRIQRAVGVNADGIFGSGTEAAVKAYQRRHGLSADGIVGPSTWNVMF